MLFNFTKFVEWSGPKGDAKTPVVIGVAGDDAVYDALEGLSRERTGGRALVVKRIDQPADTEASHLVYVGKGAQKRLPDFVTLRRGVVTVGDGESFVKAGGTIGFIVAENRLRFEVNLAGATATGVTVSSRLLRLATGVKQ